MKKLNVINYNDAEANKDFRYPGTYLHGELEDEIGFDIFAFDKETDFGVGEHEVFIEESGRHATFFLWTGDHHIRKWRGFLIYTDDSEYYYCKRAFLTREVNI